MNVVYRPEVYAEIQNAIDDYEMKESGLGQRFLTALKTQIDRLSDNPELYGVCFEQVRAVPLHRFPFVIYYRIESEHVLILAVQHGRRSVLKWRRRMD